MYLDNQPEECFRIKTINDREKKCIFYNNDSLVIKVRCFKNVIFISHISHTYSKKLPSKNVNNCSE